MSTYNRVIASGTSDTLSVPMKYLDKEHIKVSINGTLQSPTSYSWPTSNQIKFNAGNPTAGSVLEARRETPTEALVTFQPGNLDPADLNTATLQPLFLAEEAKGEVDEANEKIDAVYETVAASLEAAELAAANAGASADAAAASAALAQEAAELLASGALASPKTRADLKDIDVVAITSAYLSEAGREGLFVWTTGNFSSLVALDGREGVYVASNSVPASSGAWVRKFTGPAWPEWFENVGDTDNRASIQAAIDVVNWVHLKFGKTYTVSPNATFPGVTGTYSSASVCLNVKANTKLGGFGTLLLAAGSAAGSGAVIGNPLNPGNANGVELRDFTIDGNDANVPGSFSGVNILNSEGAVIENLKVHDVPFLGIGIRTELVLDIDGIPPDNTVAPTRYGAIHSTIRGNRVWNCGDIGIQVSCPNGLIISGNHITHCGGNGIDVYGNDPAASFNFGQDVLITNNVIQETLNGICVESFLKWVVSGNMISASIDTAMWINSINTKGVYGTISGNVMYKGAGAGLDAIRFQSGAGRCIVANNLFHGFDNAIDINSGGVGVQLGDNHYAALGKYVLRVPQAANAAQSVMLSGTQFVEANGPDANGWPQLHSPSDAQVPSRYSQFQVLGALYSFLGIIPRNFVKPGTWSIVGNGGWGGAKAIYNVGGDGRTRVQFAGSPIPSINNYLRSAGAIYAIMGDAGGSALFVRKWNGSAFVEGDFVADFASLTGPNDAPEKYASWWPQ